ncbi:MAG: DUF523 domain-containing protein [Sphaerochaetaceae bacterium]|jgi:uncharacterized protein YbbK (DUF523 family)|nr:DUF523 domain-containing protein [Sphaerochaetaceae bacterium]
MADKNQVIVTEKIVIGISACSMGCPVRYDGKGTDSITILGREKTDFIWVPVCPECMAGLGVPRESVHLSGGDGTAVWLKEATVKNRKGIEVVEALKLGCHACLDTLKRAKVSAFIYRDGSPSCGVYRTSMRSQKRGNPPGVFGSLLLEQGYFLIPADDLQSPIKWWDWRRRLLAFHWLSTVRIETLGDIHAVWYKLKFLCQELDNEYARRLGRTIASLDKHLPEGFIEQFRKELLQLLRKPSNLKRITQSLWKNYAHYRKATGKKIDEINSPEFQRNVTTIAKELVKMERSAVEDQILFGTSPVVYRDEHRLRALREKKEEQG